MGCAQKMHVAEDPQCTTGFRRKAAFSDTVSGNEFFRDRSEENHKGGGCTVSHLCAKTAQRWATRVHLLADAELSNDRLIALGIVSFEVVE